MKSLYVLRNNLERRRRLLLPGEEEEEDVTPELLNMIEIKPDTTQTLSQP